MGWYCDCVVQQWIVVDYKFNLHIHPLSRTKKMPCNKRFCDLGVWVCCAIQCS